MKFIQASKCRVFGESSKKQLQQTKENEESAKLEENPKLKLVSDVLEEIRNNEDNKILGPPVTLIVCAEDRACSQLKQVSLNNRNILIILFFYFRQYLLIGGRAMLERLLEQTLNSSTTTEVNKESETKKSTVRFLFF